MNEQRRPDRRTGQHPQGGRPTVSAGALAVFYDEGSAGPLEIAAALRGDVRLVFVVARSEHCARLRTVLTGVADAVVGWTDATAAAQELRRLEGCSGVLCFSEPMLPAAAATAAILRLAFNSPATVERLVRKDVQRATLNLSAALAVRHRPLTNAVAVRADLDHVGIPAVLKPIRGRGSRATYLVHTLDDVLTCVQGSGGMELPDFQLEELLGGEPDRQNADYVSVETLSVAGARYHLAVTQKFPLAPPFREPGNFWGPLGRIDPAGLLAITSMALDQLGVTEGLTHTEIKLTLGGPRVLEVNGRLGGFINVLAKPVLGVDLIALGALAARGLRPPMALPFMFDEYHYAFSNLPPAGASRMLHARGYESARSMAGVRQANPLMQAPADLEPGVATQELDVVTGTARTKVEMVRTLRRVVNALEFTFEFDGGKRRTFRGSALPSSEALVPRSPPAPELRRAPRRRRSSGVDKESNMKNPTREHSVYDLDCMVIGFNEGSFPDYAALVRAGGTTSPAFRDLRLAFVDHDGVPRRALELIDAVRPSRPAHSSMLSNMDFVAPAITVLATRLRKDGHRVHYVNLFQRDRSLLEERLRSGRVRSVAITTTLYIHPDPILEIVALVRAVSARTKIVIGGPYVNNLALTETPEACAEIFGYLGGDVYVISREGEATLSSLLSAWKLDAAVDNIPNLALADAEGGFRFTPSLHESNSLEKCPPDYSFIRPQDRGRFLATRTAKSCPFSCAFCAFPARSGKYTYLAVDQVEAELDRIAALPGVDTVTFIDDTFNVPRRRFHSILTTMIHKQYGFRWNCFYRSDHGNEETIELMRQAGCEGVFLGIESGSDRILENMNKTARRRHYEKAIAGLRAAEISTYASLIIGFPGETDDTVAETVSLIENAGPDFFRAQLWYCDPSTPVWQERDRYGIVGQAFNWRHDTMSSERAADIVEKLFREIENSVWLPQWGFEQWSVFYLQRLGMTHEQVKQYVRTFNSIVAEQLAGDCRDALHSRHLAEVERLAGLIGRAEVAEPAAAGPRAASHAGTGGNGAA